MMTELLIQLRVVVIMKRRASALLYYFVNFFAIIV